MEKALLLESAKLEAEREAREIELSLKISAEQEREFARKRFAETEPATSNYVIQFRCPNGVLKRHFLPTDRWNVEVYQFLKCHLDPNQRWALFDPVNTSSPLITSDGNEANGYTIADYSNRGTRFSFIVTNVDE